MALITGNTYPVRTQLKALGGRWEPHLKGWLVPDTVAEEAAALVGTPQTRRTGGRRSGRCQQCGSGIRYGVYCGKCEFGR